MRTLFFIPPLPRMSGGIAVLYQIADRLRELGHECLFTSVSPDAPGLEEQRAWGASVVPWPAPGSALPGMGAEDVYLVPEGWPNALAPGLAASMRCVVYVQNWAYLLSALPAGVRWSSLPVRFLAVSQPVAWFLRDLLGLPARGVVRPAIDRALYAPGDKSGKTLRIAWMPRKNKALGEQIRAITEASLATTADAPSLEWLELHRMSPVEVAEGLGKSHVFLCTGFPEGFSLPPLEAMACGCLPVGFSGFGGWDYMRDARTTDAANPYPPRLPLRETAWQANGFYAMDGDVLGAVLALKDALHTMTDNPAAREALLAAGQRTVADYSAAAQCAAVNSAWESLEKL